MVNLFISYSHTDEAHIESFIRFMTPLQNKWGFEVWNDRKIAAGSDFWKCIDEHLEGGDVICLFLSSYYLASAACRKEMEYALNLRNKRNVTVVPIILSVCMWTENERLTRLLALPTDGKPVESFTDCNVAWKNVCDGLKPVVATKLKFKQLGFSNNFAEFLNDASLFTKTHGNKETLTMDDIFVSPDLDRYNEIKNKHEKVHFDDICSGFTMGDKLIISGEDQSGKTTLAKELVRRLKNQGYIPIYLKDEEQLLQGNLDYRIACLFKEQYDTAYELKDYNQMLVVPIIDDFHKTNKRERALRRLADYRQLILIVDTIFDIEFFGKDIASNFIRFRIREMLASLRHRLIVKWLSITDRVDSDNTFINNDLAQIDDRTAMIDQATGKAFGQGMMPAYPFFLLMLLSNYETLNDQINDKIASQGHYYQVLILYFLNRVKVTNEKLDAYLNFLTELAYAIFQNNGALSQVQFEDFYIRYDEEFNMPEKRSVLIEKLKQSTILKMTSIGNIDFSYPYLYYFFAGKYFAEQITNKGVNQQTIAQVENMLDNLHKNENAYIIIFLIHHTKDMSLLEKIENRADEMFNDFQPATLEKEELSFFRSNIISQPKLLEDKQDVREEREKHLAIQDRIEESQQNGEDDNEDDDCNELVAKLRRSIKTVEVMGYIIKNRSGSSKAMLENLFLKGTNVHLRILSSYFDVVKKLIKEDNYDDFIQKRVKENNPKFTLAQVEELSQKIFWNTCFGMILAIIERTTRALGAKTLVKVSDNVCDKIDTPISFIIKQNIAMRYQHNIRLNEIKSKDLRRYSPITKNALFVFVNRFCKYNRLSDVDKQKLKKIGLDIKSIPLLPEK